MKIETIDKYLKHFNQIKNQGNIICEYCEENLIDVKRFYNFINKVKKDKNISDEARTLVLNTWESIKRNNKEVSTQESDEFGMEWWADRNDDDIIVCYHIHYPVKDSVPFNTTLTREDAETLFGLYTYYGGNITSRNVANEFPKYTLTEIKRIFKVFKLTKDSIWVPPHLLEELTPEQLTQYRMNLKERAAFKYADATQEREFKNTLNKLASKVKQLEDRNEFYKNLALNETSFTKLPKLNKEKSETTGIVLLSDIHVGAINTTNGYLPLTDYSEQEVNLRLDRILEKLCKKNWNNIIIINLGDSVDSYKGTTAKGTPLPTYYSDKEMSKMYMRVMMRFMTSIKNLFNNVQYICTGDSNHDGSFGWLNNVALSYQLENIGIPCYISDNPIDNVNIGEFSIIYLHGHDSKTQYKGFPLTLDEKTKNWFNNYFLQAPVELKKNKIVVKGDLHQFALNSCNTFDYINVPSIYGSSSWIVSNFGKGKQGATVLEIRGDEYNINTIWV